MARTADKLISDIRKEVSSGILKPGDQLEVTALAERFGVSRTPIREAIRTLVESGVLETRPRKGSFVRVLSAKQLLDLFQVAAELEGMACRLAALSLTKENVEAIERGLAKCTQAAEVQNNAEYAMANLDFHTAIHNASGNDWLIEQLRQLQINLNSYRTMPYEIRGRLNKSTVRHAHPMCLMITSGFASSTCANITSSGTSLTPRQRQSLRHKWTKIAFGNVQPNRLANAPKNSVHGPVLGLMIRIRCWVPMRHRTLVRALLPAVVCPPQSAARLRFWMPKTSS